MDCGCLLEPFLAVAKNENTMTGLQLFGLIGMVIFVFVCGAISDREKLRDIRNKEGGKDFLIELFGIFYASCLGGSILFAIVGVAIPAGYNKAKTAIASWSSKNEEKNKEHKKDEKVASQTQQTSKKSGTKTNSRSSSQPQQREKIDRNAYYIPDAPNVSNDLRCGQGRDCGQSQLIDLYNTAKSWQEAAGDNRYRWQRAQSNLAGYENRIADLVARTQNRFGRVNWCDSLAEGRRQLGSALGNLKSANYDMDDAESEFGRAVNAFPSVSQFDSQRRYAIEGFSRHMQGGARYWDQSMQRYNSFLREFSQSMERIETAKLQWSYWNP